MTIEEKKRQLAKNRLEQADESIDEARYLFEGDKSPRAIINRAYYAMFYAIFSGFDFRGIRIVKAFRCAFVFQ